MRMPPPPVVCPGCQAHAQHARPHADGSGRPEKTELLEDSGLVGANTMLLPGRATVASVCYGTAPLFTQQTSGERMRPSGESIRARLWDRPHVAESGRFMAITQKNSQQSAILRSVPTADIYFKAFEKSHTQQFMNFYGAVFQW